MDIKNHLSKAIEQMGKNFKVDGIIEKKGHFKDVLASEVEDVVGFDYIICSNETCYECYIANPPYLGATHPKHIHCPLGLEVIKEYNIDYKEAIRIFHKGDWGGSFSSIELKKPLHPDVKEPCWYFKSDLGNQIIIGANSGEVLNIESDNCLCGGWSIFRTDITEEEKEVFNKAVKLEGVSYTPIAVASQVVAGMNYKFFCNAKVVYPNSPNEAAMITIYRPLNGEAHIKEIKIIKE